MCHTPAEKSYINAESVDNVKQRLRTTIVLFSLINSVSSLNELCESLALLSCRLI